MLLFSRGVVRAANDVSFTVRKGEILSIVGESGSGKTVIALSILRLIPYPGKIVGGRSSSGVKTYLKNQVLK